ncbi:MAG: hypothetical protein WCO84_04420 [bacterium]
MDTITFLRTFRVGEYALFDFGASFLGFALLSPILSKIFSWIGVYVPKMNWIFLTIPFSIIAHLAVGQMTPMTKNFLDTKDHYILKIVIVSLLLLGLRGIKLIR